MDHPDAGGPPRGEQAGDGGDHPDLVGGRRQRREPRTGADDALLHLLDDDGGVRRPHE